MPITPIQRRTPEFLEAVDGMLTFGIIGADLSVTTTATEPLDLMRLVELFGLFHAASIQVAPATTALTVVVVALQVSNDGRKWVTRASTSPGEGMVLDIDVTGVRFLRLAVTTIEGAGEVGDIICCLTRDAE